MDWLADPWTTLDRTEKFFSIVASIATVGVAIAAQSIRNAVIVRARLPQDQETLQRYVSELRQVLAAMQQADTQVQDAREMLSKIHGTLIGLKVKLRGENRRIARKIIISIEKTSGVKTTIDDLWSVYNDLLTLIEAVRIYEKDVRLQ